jgi:uncharacterized protein (TIGR03382 family)
MGTVCPVFNPPSCPFVGDIVHIIDQSGLSTGYTSGVTDFQGYLAGGPTHIDDPATAWIAVGHPSGHVDFDLGSPMEIAAAAIWNYSNSTNFAAMTQITLFGSLDAGFASSTNLGTFNLTVPPIFTSDTAQVLAFGPINARYIRLAVENPTLTPALNEVAFDVVPEPATLTLALAGLAALFYRRRTAR